MRQCRPFEQIFTEMNRWLPTEEDEHSREKRTNGQKKKKKKDGRKNYEWTAKSKNTRSRSTNGRHKSTSARRKRTSSRQKFRMTNRKVRMVVKKGRQKIRNRQQRGGVANTKVQAVVIKEQKKDYEQPSRKCISADRLPADKKMEERYGSLARIILDTSFSIQPFKERHRPTQCIALPLTYLDVNITEVHFDPTPGRDACLSQHLSSQLPFKGRSNLFVSTASREA